MRKPQNPSPAHLPLRDTTTMHPLYARCTETPGLAEMSFLRSRADGIISAVRTQAASWSLVKLYTSLTWSELSNYPEPMIIYPVSYTDDIYNVHWSQTSGLPALKSARVPFSDYDSITNKKEKCVKRPGLLRLDYILHRQNSLRQNITAKVIIIDYEYINDDSSIFLE